MASRQKPDLGAAHGVPARAAGEAHVPASTPGPWEVRWRFGRRTTVSGPQHYPICDTGTAPLASANHQREEANARLIAAAPDLLEALRVAQEMIDVALPQFDWGRSALSGDAIRLLNETPGKVRAALSKATGASE